MKSLYLSIGAASLLMACMSNTQFVLEQPVAHRCATAGLRDCQTITRATLLYADGDAPAARKGLLSGLASNADQPQAMEQFALGLEQVGAKTDGGEYQSSLDAAVWLVRFMAQRNTVRLVAKNAPPPAAVPAPQPETKATLIGTSLVPESIPSLSGTDTLSQSSSSTFFMLAGNALAADCRFPGAPKMLCLHESVETPKVVSDVIISPACPYDVLFGSRHGIELDWVTYAPAGKGAEVHGAALPLVPGRILTAGVSYESADITPDVRCGITVVWHEVAQTRLPAPPRQTKLDFTR